MPPQNDEEERAELEHAMEIIKESWYYGWAVTLQRVWRALSTQAAAEYLGISRPTLIKILTRGDIPFRWIGNARMVQMADLHEYESQRGVAAAASIRQGRSPVERRLKMKIELLAEMDA